MNQCTNSKFRLSDFFIGALRKETGLWFEINELEWDHRYVNQAQITDGETFLSVWISGSRSDFHDVESLKLGEADPLYVGWQARYDSRRQFGSHFLQEVYANALKFFPSNISVDSYRLLSFEFSGTDYIGDLTPIFNAIRGDCVLQELPFYNGTLCDSADFELTPASNAKWLQLTFPNPVARQEVLGLMSSLVDDIRCVQVEANKIYTAAPQLRDVNISRLRCFGRRW